MEREFDLRTVPTPDDGTLAIQWMRLTRLDLAEDEPWPAAALGLICDMVGAGPYRATLLALGTEHATLALDLTLHIATALRGPWALGVFENIAMTGGRVTGQGELFDERGGFVARITQQMLVRPIRAGTPAARGAAAEHTSPARPRP